MAFPLTAARSNRTDFQQLLGRAPQRKPGALRPLPGDLLPRLFK